MKQENLEELLRDLSLSAVAKNAMGEEDISDVLFELDAAVKSRRIVDCVQFEECWKDQIDGSQQPYLFINFKLSPEVCAAAFENGKEANELTWNLVLPFINGLDADELPESVYDWLDLAEVHLATESTEIYECLMEIIQMDEDAI